MVSAPALARRWWASAGAGAFADGRRCQVSDVAHIADAQVCVTFSPGWDELGLTDELVDACCSRRGAARGFGDFWQHCLVAEGAIDLAIDAVGVMPYDLAAVKVIVEEAGGTFTDRHGEATHEHDTAISSNGLLHAAGARCRSRVGTYLLRRTDPPTRYGCADGRRRSRSRSTVSTPT